MLKCKLLLLTLAMVAVSASQAQKLPTAEKRIDLQVGGEGLYGESDYGRTMNGYGIYSTIDFMPHLGFELGYHKADATDLIYERTYEAGVRYVRHYGRFNPYGKFMVGRGVFNFPPYYPGGESRANLAYNLIGFGGGVDYRLKHYLNLRGNFEYQEWGSSPGFLPNGLSPYFATIGVAFHFR